MMASRDASFGIPTAFHDAQIAERKYCAPRASKFFASEHDLQHAAQRVSIRNSIDELARRARARDFSGSRNAMLSLWFLAYSPFLRSLCAVKRRAGICPTKVAVTIRVSTARDEQDWRGHQT
jgi:hypothetical protein